MIIVRCTCNKYFFFIYQATRGREEGKESHVSVSNKSVNESRASSSSASSVNSKMENVQQETEKLRNDTKGEVQAESVQEAVKINTTVDAPQVSATTKTTQESSQNISISQEAEAGLKANLAEAPQGTGTTTKTQESSQSISVSQETVGESVPTSQVTTAASVSKESEEEKATSFNRGSEEKTVTATTQPSQQQQKVCEAVRSEGRRLSKGVALPIVTRGQFFNDSFFEGTWKNYQDAVREVLARWDRSSSPVTSSDDMTCYRKLRTRDMRDENQAVTTSEDESSYKVSYSMCVCIC